MSGDYYIPRGDALFDGFFRGVKVMVVEKTSGSTPEWSHIGPIVRQRLVNDYDDWRAAYEETLGPHTSVQTAEKNRVRKVVQKGLADFVNQYLRYPPVTDQERDAMGIPNRPAGHSPVPVPTTSPILTVDTGTIRRLIIYYRDEHSSGRGKPRNVHGIEIRWNIQETPPESIEELIHSSFDTRSPLVLEFGEEDRGKRVYLVGAWEIEREGLKGPYGAIVEAIIP